MTGTADLSFEQLFTIHRSAQETDQLIHRILIHPASNKAVRVEFKLGSRSLFFGVERGGKRVVSEAV